MADGETVWFRNPDAKSPESFLMGVVDSSDGEMRQVKQKGSGTQHKLRKEDLFGANPDGLVTPDNTMLIHLSEPTILENVQQRFKAKEIYTLTGTILLAMNPFQQLPIYTDEKKADYKGKRMGQAPPHVYAVSECAYQSLAKMQKSQSVLVSGESGAGKTETNKALMYYLAWRSKNSGGQQDLAEVILQSNPVLEAFGNAKTSRNNNSSRFGKFIKILMDKKGNIVGAQMAQYLLEKSRIVRVRCPSPNAAAAASTHPT
jgi:myosin heavy subunit